MYVMGGGREAPNPSNEVDIYDPVANSWSVGTPFVEVAAQLPDRHRWHRPIWLSGGYGSDGVTVLDSMEIFTCPVSPCASPSPTPTSDGNGDAYCYRGAEVYSYAQAASHTAASAVALRAPNDWAIDD